MRAAIALGLLVALPAFAAPMQTWGVPPIAYVELKPSDLPGVWAEVEFQNSDVHGQDREDFTLTLNGVSVKVRLEADRAYGQPDVIHVTVPEGFRAEPPMISVEEGDTGTVLIYSELVG